MKIVKINENDYGIRIDKFIIKLFPHWKKNFVFQALRTKKIKVNKKKVSPSYHLAINDLIYIYLNEKNFCDQKDNQRWKLAKSEIDVVYEDKNLLVINKPTKLVVVDQKDQKNDTLINRAKLYLYKKNEWDESKYFTPCLLHRLDTNTKGLIMIAKNYQTARILSQKIKNHEVEKYYQCLVYGKFNLLEQKVKAFWFKPKDNNFVKIAKTKINHNYLPISMIYRVISYDKAKNISRLEIKLITGKTHQIRAHLNFLCHPIVGEQKYIKKEYKKIDKYKSQCLIATKICFNFQKDSTFLDYLKNKEIRLKKIIF